MWLLAIRTEEKNQTTKNLERETRYNEEVLDFQFFRFFSI